MSYGPPITVAYSDGDYAAAAFVSASGNGYVSVWTVTYFTGNEIRVIGTLRVPVYGASLREATQSAQRIAKTVTEFASSSWGGEGSAGYVRAENAANFAVALMRLHSSNVAGYSDLEKTAIYYTLMSEMKIPNPAELIAVVLGVKSVRTIHDRIARARLAGHLESRGQGRVF